MFRDAGAERIEVPLAEIHQYHRKLYADDVLYNRCRMDALLLLSSCHGYICRRGQRQNKIRLCRDAFQRAWHGFLDNSGVSYRFCDLLFWNSKRGGAGDKGYDDLPDGSDGSACCPLDIPEGCGEGNRLLPRAGFPEHGGARCRKRHLRCNESGVLHLVHRNRSHADLRFLPE